ncbi:MAG: type VI secretion system protein TssA [Phycisphaerales bacterium]|nr:type VI secretion system protein TssA [Phycisphaerales bacterium]
MPIDVDGLLRPVSEAAPCGEELRYDRRYLEVMRLAEGKPEQQIGDTIVPGEEPNWREVCDGCLELFARSKDLRVAMLLCLANLRLEGYPGLRDGLRIVKGIVDTYWDGLFPILDPDDGNDPTERMNIVGSLAVPPGSFGDPMRFQDRIREASIVQHRQLGRVGLRELLIVAGDLPASTDASAPKLDSTAIEAIFEEVETPQLEEIAKTIEECAELVKGLEDSLTVKVGAGKAIDLSSFRGMPVDAAKAVRKRLAKRGVGGPAGAIDETTGTLGGGGGARLAGEIYSSSDVREALDKIVRYYELREPSSPVALVMQCAHQLVDKSFLDIVRVLTPDAIQVLERIKTPPDQGQSG